MTYLFNPNGGSPNGIDSNAMQQMAEMLRKPTQQQQAPQQPANNAVSTGVDVLGKLAGPLMSMFGTPSVTDGGYSVGQGSTYNGTTDSSGMFTPLRKGM